MKLTLRRFNNVLSLVVIGLGLYIALSPFFPQIAFLLRDKSPETSAPYAGELAEAVGSTASNTIPEDNRIVIPSIQINEPIVQSRYISAIADGGTWLRPNTVAPTDPGNSVIVGHRFYQSDVSTFYHLDKVQIGDRMAVYWEGEEIVYEVTETKIVDATQVDIEDQTPDTRLTLYTCHPIWTAKERLVVIARPITAETAIMNDSEGV